jgi:hypothetical protein
VKSGVPYDSAMAMEEAELLAHAVAFGEIEGGTWCWDRLQWERKE